MTNLAAIHKAARRSQAEKNRKRNRREAFKASQTPADYMESTKVQVLRLAMTESELQRADDNGRVVDHVFKDGEMAKQVAKDDGRYIADCEPSGINHLFGDMAPLDRRRTSCFYAQEVSHQVSVL